MIDAMMVWLPSLLISLVAVAALVYLAYHNRAKLDRLQRSHQQRSEQLVEQFLQRESRITRHHLQTPTDSDTLSRLAQMRRCWLEAELAALVDHGKHHSDYQLLQNAAMPLLRLTQRNLETAKASTPRWSSTASNQYLQQTRAAVSAQQQAIQHFKACQAGAVTSTKFWSSLDSIENNTAALLEIIEKLTAELTETQRKFDAVSKKLATSQAPTPPSSHPPAFSISRATVSTERNNSADEDSSELLDEMESAYTNSITEMKKMSGINRQQRHLIILMEKELQLLRKDTSEYQASSDVLEKLKLQLRDYENCTTILEMESDSLREQIQNLRKTITRNGGPGESPIDEVTGLPLSTVATNQSAAADTSLLELIGTLSAAENLESISSQLVTWLTAQDIASVIYIKGKLEEVWAASDGHADDHRKRLLKSMLPVLDQPIIEVREGILFIYSTLRILLYSKGDFHEKNGSAQLRLCAIFSTANQILKLFEEKLILRQSRHQVDVIQKRIHNLNIQHHYLDTEHITTGKYFRKEIDEYLLTSNATEVQRRCIFTMLQDFDSQLEILSKTGKLIEAGLRTVIQDLDKLSK